MSRVTRSLVAAVTVGLASACTSVCPTGTHLRGGPASPGSWQTCERGDRTVDNVPAPGRTYEATLGIANPTAHGRLADGPALQWYPNGRLRAYGRFSVDRAGHSAANGLWTFFWRNGRRRAQVRYSMGRPVGCVLTWSVDGRRTAYRAVGDRLRLATCDARLDARADRLAARYAHRQRNSRHQFSAELAYGSPPTRLRLRADELDPSPRIAHYARLAVRRAFGPMRLGVAVDATTAPRESGCASAGLLGTVPVPVGPRWIDIDLTAEAGARRYSVVPADDGVRWNDSLELSTGYTAGRLAFGVLLGDNVGLYTTGSVDYELTATSEQSHSFCKAIPHCDTCPLRCWMVDANWKTGGIAYGITASVRVMLP